MSDNQNPDEFLKDLQGECLNNSGEYLDKIQEEILALKKNPIQVIDSILKVCHNLKGNFQAVGYPFISKLYHDFEDGLNLAKSHIQERSELSDSDFDILEFFLNDILDSLSNYTADLLKQGVDSEELFQKRSQPVGMLETWAPQPGGKSEGPVTQPSEGTEEVAIQKSEEQKGKKDEKAPGAEATVAVDDPGIESLSSKEIRKKKEEQIEKKTEIEKSLFLLCQSQKRLYALPIENIVEVVNKQRLNRLPTQRRDIHGMLNLRGDALPILNFDRTFEVDPVGEEALKRYCVVAQANESKFGFEIEEVKHVIELNRTEFHTVEQIDSLSDGDLVSHYSILDDETVLVIDLEKAVAA